MKDDDDEFEVLVDIGNGFQIRRAPMGLEVWHEEIPVGHLYSMLLDKMKKLTGLPEGA